MRVDKRDDIERLEEIKKQIKSLTHEAMQIVRGTSQEQRAKGYWYAHIMMALDDDHDFLGSGGATIADAADALADEEEQHEQEYSK